MNSMVKMLIIVTLIYYFLKGLIYLMLWIATHKVEENARERKRKRHEQIKAKHSTLRHDGENPP
ncbi:MAG TPA: hypothetical protein DER33_07685 [Syntrophomonas sp.]|jgi:hypothetical protein|nr:hypothetical protein [Syntrophomonas sp.]HCF71447.1 hypothetical protein [Syntrophomonas sp.]